ncbi:MAG: HD domain-containing protein [Cyclobacteriaceae bacterium]
MNKRKVFNDPVYGFINIPSDLIFDIIAHPYFQRLRRIRQMGLADFVYPGALHTRFHHALGAMHLMQNTLGSLRYKGQEISDDEFEATLIAILLHDIGHGPFSHALEYVLLPGIGHEQMSQLIIRHICDHFGGNTELAYRIFSGQYERKFFHQLVSSQLDIDRLDYLKRDCFYTGVSEGEIGADRIIKMLDVRNDEIVVEEKGIYSIENFLNARRLMYWQVYLHKTSVSAEKMLISTISRAIYLARSGMEVPAGPALAFFLKKPVLLEELKQQPEYLKTYAALDDIDIWAAIKMWQDHPDRVLSELSRRLLERRLFRIRLSNEAPDEEGVQQLAAQLKHKMQLNDEELPYFMVHGHISNAAYVSEGQKINIITKEGKIFDIAQASDLPNIKAMSKIVKKYYLCWPKDVVPAADSLDHK